MPSGHKSYNTRWLSRSQLHGDIVDGGRRLLTEGTHGLAKECITPACLRAGLTGLRHKTGETLRAQTVGTYYRGGW
jgi:hypothetical protein